MMAGTPKHASNVQLGRLIFCSNFASCLEVVTILKQSNITNSEWLCTNIKKNSYTIYKQSPNPRHIYIVELRHMYTYMDGWN